MSDPPSHEQLQTWDDDALVAYVQKTLQGQSAFAELYRRHVTRIYRYLLARVGNEQDAQDLTAQTFLAALESIPSFRGESRFTTWLFGIAHHRALDHYRKQRPVVALEFVEEISDSEPLPDETVNQQLQLEDVMRVMQVLSKDRAEALALHSFGGLTVKEVANVMHKKEAAVRMLIHRAIRDLQTRLVLQEGAQ